MGKWSKSITSINLEEGDKEYEISIKDTGVGMTQEQIDNLFRMEYTQSTKGTANESGTGLGLLLCSDFIKRNGGRISVESEADRGSTFSFTLRAK